MVNYAKNKSAHSQQHFQKAFISILQNYSHKICNNLHFCYYRICREIHNSRKQWYLSTILRPPPTPSPPTPMPHKMQPTPKRRLLQKERPANSATFPQKTSLKRTTSALPAPQSAEKMRLASSADLLQASVAGSRGGLKGLGELLLVPLGWGTRDRGGLALSITGIGLINSKTFTIARSTGTSKIWRAVWCKTEATSGSRIRCVNMSTSSCRRVYSMTEARTIWDRIWMHWTFQLKLKSSTRKKWSCMSRWGASNQKWMTSCSPNSWESKRIWWCLADSRQSLSGTSASVYKLIMESPEISKKTTSCKDKIKHWMRQIHRVRLCQGLQLELMGDWKVSLKMIVKRTSFYNFLRE